MNQIIETKKVLIGWPSINGELLLAGNNYALLTTNLKEQVQKAIASVQSRSVYTNQGDVISEPAPELEQYINQFWQKDESDPFKNQGWAIKIADLNKVCSIQPFVECKSSVEKTKEINQNNLIRIAEISLPISKPQSLLPSFDPVKKAWVFSSPNPNLKLLQPYTNQNTIFEFVVGIPNSFVQVVKCKERYFVRDGYHRAYGFMANGISKIPILYREFNSFNEMGLSSGFFPNEILMSDHPPMLTDFFNDKVSGIAQFTQSLKVVLIQGLEINTFG